MSGAAGFWVFVGAGVFTLAGALLVVFRKSPAPAPAPRPVPYEDPLSDMTSPGSDPWGGVPRYVAPPPPPREVPLPLSPVDYYRAIAAQHAEVLPGRSLAYLEDNPWSERTCEIELGILLGARRDERQPF